LEVKRKLAYDIRKIAAYGSVGVIMASLIILAFILAPFKEVVGFVPIVELESIIDGSLAITIITDVSLDVTQIKLTMDKLEVKLNGNWTEVDVPGGIMSFDLLKHPGTFFDALSYIQPGSTIRIHVMQGFEYANATLSNGDIVNLSLPNETIEVETPLRIGQRVYIIKGGA
jgi:hypothetical protein